MHLKNYYELLGITPTAPADKVKQAFRQQIARYHPDKVQHLGKEFQEMAAARAAELTEAYRILSDEGKRAEYDQARATQAGARSPATEWRSPAPEPKASGQFKEAREGRDALVRKAILDHFRQAFAQVAGDGYDESSVHGFDVAWLPKAKLFARHKRPRLVGKFVSRVDAAAVADAWMQAGKWHAPRGEDICVVLMGTTIASPRELADAIAEQRRRPLRGGKVTLIPVNASHWDAHIPVDAPGVAKDLLAQLRVRR